MINESLRCDPEASPLAPEQRPLALVPSAFLRLFSFAATSASFPGVVLALGEAPFSTRQRMSAGDCSSEVPRIKMTSPPLLIPL